MTGIDLTLLNIDFTGLRFLFFTLTMCVKLLIVVWRYPMSKCWKNTTASQEAGVLLS